MLAERTNTRGKKRNPLEEEPLHLGTTNRVALVDENGVVYYGVVLVRMDGTPAIPTPDRGPYTRPKEAHLRWMSLPLREAVVADKFNYREVWSALTTHLMKRMSAS